MRKQGRYVGDQAFSGDGNSKPSELSKRIAGKSDKSRRPHQRRVKDRVWDERCATLIARATAIWADDVIVVDAYGHRLRVAKTECGRMAAGTGVVTMQSQNFVEEQEASEISHAPDRLGGQAALQASLQLCL